MANLTLSPDYVYEEKVNFKTLVTEFESGYEQRRAKWATPLRRFKLLYKARTSTDFGTIKSLFIEKLGAYDTFTWTNPNDSTTYTCRFVEDSLAFEEQAYDIYNFEFEIIEVR